MAFHRETFISLTKGSVFKQGRSFFECLIVDVFFQGFC